MNERLSFIKFKYLDPADDNFYLFESSMADAVFYFLPILIGFNAAIRLGSNVILTAVIGNAINYPTLLKS